MIGINVLRGCAGTNNDHAEQERWGNDENFLHGVLRKTEFLFELIVTKLRSPKNSISEIAVVLLVGLFSRLDYDGFFITDERRLRCVSFKVG